ncbi:MAG: carcinine hydrolase/isopenicillin-N N-acyltransferase family protein [Vampirovibrionia bacterium]
MYKRISILITILLLVCVQVKVYSIELKVELDKDLDGLTNKKCAETNQCGLNENLFDYTHSKTEVSVIDNIKIYRIKQNNDSRYNVGYSYGKSIIMNNPDYAKDLKSFLNTFRELQSNYKLDEVLTKIAKSLPCWITQEMNGLASALSTNEDNITITYEDIVLLNTVVLWTKLPQKDPKAPPAAPTSITPIKKNKDKLESSLAAISNLSDQTSFIISLDKTLLTNDSTVVIRNYSRKFSNFVNKTESILIFDLDNVSFMTIGLEGMMCALSGINDNGVSIHTIQASNQDDERIIGATPPTILTRMALETSTTAQEAQQTLNHVKPSLEQAFVIADKDNQFIINTEIKNDTKDIMNENVTQQKIIIYNFNTINKNQSITNYFESLNTKLSLEDIINKFNQEYSSVNPKEKNIFNTIYDIKDKSIWYQIPNINENEPGYHFINIGFGPEKAKEEVTPDE